MSTDLKAHYDEYYDGRSAWREVGARAKARNVDRLWRRHGPGGDGATRVLEIGCGEGAVLERLRDMGYAARGVELSESGVAASTARGLDVELYDGQRLPYGEGDFDLAVLTHVVEHLEHPRQVLREATRVAPWVFVEVPLEYGWRTPADFRWTPLGHINLFDRKLARHLLQSCGLEVVGEWVGGPDLESYRFRFGRAWGSIVWTVRSVGLKVLRPLALRLLTYHGAFLCRSASRPAPSSANGDE